MELITMQEFKETMIDALNQMVEISEPYIEFEDKKQTFKQWYEDFRLYMEDC